MVFVKEKNTYLPIFTMTRTVNIGPLFTSIAVQ